jgi:hypothetical protein
MTSRGTSDSGKVRKRHASVGSFETLKPETWPSPESDVQTHWCKSSTSGLRYQCLLILVLNLTLICVEPQGDCTNALGASRRFKLATIGGFRIFAMLAIPNPAFEFLKAVSQGESAMLVAPRIGVYRIDILGKLKSGAAKLIDSPTERSVIVDHLALCNLEYQAIGRNTGALRGLQRAANRSGRGIYAPRQKVEIQFARQAQTRRKFDRGDAAFLIEPM